MTSWSRYEPHGPCACPDLPSPEVRRRANEVVAATGLYLLLLAFPAALVWHAGRPKPLPPRVVLRGAALEGTRCAFCHDGSDGATTACASCGALLHADCWGIAGRCPTLGCGPPRPRPASPGPGPGAPLTIVVRAAA